MATTRTISIEGMSCGHCVSWISEALKKIDGVTDAQLSLEAKNAIVEYDEAKVTEEMIRSAIEKAGYTVKSIS